MNRVIAADRERVAVTGGYPNFEIGLNRFNPRCNRGRTAMDGVETERIHVVREAAGAADAGNHHKIFALDAELGKHRLHRGENGVVAAAWAPADFLVRLKIFFGQWRWQRGGRHFLWLQTQLPILPIASRLS